MLSRRRHFAAAAAVGAWACVPAVAGPRVTTDIAPIHSIVAAVMQGVGGPDLIVPPGASEHSYALRPSEASSLEDAELVVWVGPTLTPWLAGPIDSLAGDALLLTLTEAPGVRLMDMRSGGPFEPDAHDYGHDDAGGDAQDHDPARPDEHDDQVAGQTIQPAQAEPSADGDNAAHDHGAPAAGPDPHIWLDPQNAAAIADAVAVRLSDIDPENAAAYAANAEAFYARMEALTAELDARMKPLRGKGFFVFHDAYQYFEGRFGLPAAGSIALNDAEPPRAQRVAEIRERIGQEDIVCVFAEPQFEPKLIATVIEGAPARTGALDPLGAALEPGAGLYPALLRSLAEELSACLDPAS